jgi:hypothetical protein
MSLARQLHVYLGAFFAPLITFLVFAGVLQAFHLGTRPPDPFSRPRIWLHTGIKLPAQHSPSPEMDIRNLEADELSSPAVRDDASRKLLSWLAVAIAAILIAPGAYALFTSFKRTDDWLTFGSLIVLGTLLPIVLSFL